MKEASLAVQWITIHLAMQGMAVQFLAQEDPNAAEQLSSAATTTETVPSEHGRCNKRNLCNEKPRHRN